MMRYPLILVLSSVALLIVGSIVALSERPGDEDPSPVTLLEPILEVDPYPTTELDESALCAGFCPSAEQLEAMERMAQGIWVWKTREGDRPWWFCGEPIEDREASLRLSRMIVRQIWEGCREARAAGVELNPWGVAGTAANESGFDLCAFGLHPRRAAYELGVLKPNRLTVSHSSDDVEAALSSVKLDRRFHAYDLGMLQTLDMYYDGPREDLLGWKGFRWQILHMAARARWYGTTRPWRFWPGYDSDRYDRRVSRLARQIGATAEEI